MKLTYDYVKSKGVEISVNATEEEAMYDDYFYIACEIVHNSYYLRPSISDITRYIENGVMKIGEETVKCPITDKKERMELWLNAQLKQLLYDYHGGRGAMIRGESASTDICRDFIRNIRLLGLYQRTKYII